MKKILPIFRKMFEPIIINTNFYTFDNCGKMNSNDTSLESEYTSEDLIIENLTIVKIKETIEGHMDDFKDLFNSNSVKIYATILCFIQFTFTNAFNIFVSLFEKYGGDPLKRSLKNQLISQVGYGMMIRSTICNPLLTLRIMFGPMPLGFIFISCPLLSSTLRYTGRTLIVRFLGPIKICTNRDLYY